MSLYTNAKYVATFSTLISFIGEVAKDDRVVPNWLILNLPYQVPDSVTKTTVFDPVPFHFRFHVD